MSEQQDELIQRVVEELRRPVALDSSLDERVMARIRNEPVRLPEPRRWLLRPFTLRLSPLGALAAAAGFAALVAATTLAVVRSGWLAGVPGSAGATPGVAAVPFVLYAPDAHSVSVVGDFNDWDAAATPLKPAGPSGTWVVTVPLAPGRYRYAFVIDGTRWVPDPGAPLAPADDFGTPNSVLTVGS
ncbi:1,4-alpha-glucan branching enzyme GlgB [bacterium HR33]|nr:1,4-alpha-glucan branching enzyme GlgB [bacterium HR33]